MPAILYHPQYDDMKNIFFYFSKKIKKKFMSSYGPHTSTSSIIEEMNANNVKPCKKDDFASAHYRRTRYGKEYIYETYKTKDGFIGMRNIRIDNCLFDMYVIHGDTYTLFFVTENLETHKKETYKSYFSTYADAREHVERIKDLILDRLM